MKGSSLLRRGKPYGAEAKVTCFKGRRDSSSREGRSHLDYKEAQASQPTCSEQKRGILGWEQVRTKVSYTPSIQLRLYILLMNWQKDLQRHRQLHSKARLQGRSTPRGCRSCKCYPPITEAKEGRPRAKAARLQGKEGGGKGVMIGDQN